MQPIKPFKTDHDKEEALAAWIGEEDTTRISKWKDGEYGRYEYGGNQEYLVLTDDEADEACEKYIRESLWAFRSWFLIQYMEGIEEESIQRVQENSCESCNELIYQLVKNRFHELVSDAISSDGRGHFLAAYDNEENEQGEYFIYRTN